MDKYLRGLFDRKVQEHMITPEEILNAVTEIRTFTAIDYNTGVADKGTLRKVRVIGKDFDFPARFLFQEIWSPGKEICFVHLLFH